MRPIKLPPTNFLFIFGLPKPIFKYVSMMTEKVFYSEAIIFYDFNSISYKGKDF